MPRRLTALLAITAAAAFTAACGSPGAHSQPTAHPASPRGAADQAAHIPNQLQFTTKTLDGQTFSGATLAGKPAVLWFWTPWCPKCQQEAPVVGKTAAANPRVTFVGVAAYDHVSGMQAFVDKYQLGGLTQLADSDGAVWSRFGITQQPAWAFVGANGDIDVVKGSLTQPELTARVNGLAER
ncbi:redoxin domain-containing protein [Mycobacterium simiae]|uniref:Soluble secreted antigen MPT53 n=1 Tax=Mycobacterium simiae TaxID=1784 RepID=A0A5B1BF40_MYCSI|nr:redoxin domain-containing protein [Mycobacterium simiae]KAA1246033.1 redoxin domain-containing protein [Mycobacterium simiae]